MWRRSSDFPPNCSNDLGGRRPLPPDSRIPRPAASMIACINRGFSTVGHGGRDRQRDRAAQERAVESWLIGQEHLSPWYHGAGVVACFADERRLHDETI